MNDILELPQDTPIEKRALDEINTRLLWIGKRINQALAATNSGTPYLLVGTRAERLVQYVASDYPAGQQFLETDTGLIYVARQIASSKPGLAWYYLSGTISADYAAPLASHARLIRPLALQDEGLLFHVTDYAHVLKWDGSAWERGPSDSEHSDTFHSFAAAPTDAGWKECDGSIVAYLKYDGTTANRTLPNTKTSASYAKFGAAYSATLTAAAVPLLVMNLYTPAGTVSAPVFTGSTFTPAGTISTPIFTGTAKTWDVVSVTGAGAQSVLIDNATNQPYTPLGTISTPTFTGTGGTPAGTNSAPTFTGTAATLTGTINLSGGDPVRNFSLILMYRQ